MASRTVGVRARRFGRVGEAILTTSSSVNDVACFDRRILSSSESMIPFLSMST